MKPVLGIDPGLSGGWCLLKSLAVLECGSLPTFQISSSGRHRRELDLAMLSSIILAARDYGAHCFIEEVHSMPKQGVASTFSFGKCFGAILGVLAALGVPYELVSPKMWRKMMGVRGDKDESRMIAMRLFPWLQDRLSRKADHNIAEAILIASYGMRKLGNVSI